MDQDRKPGTDRAFGRLRRMLWPISCLRSKKGATRLGGSFRHFRERELPNTFAFLLQ